MCICMYIFLYISSKIPILYSFIILNNINIQIVKDLKNLQLKCHIKNNNTPSGGNVVRKRKKPPQEPTSFNTKLIRSVFAQHLLVRDVRLVALRSTVLILVGKSMSFRAGRFSVFPAHDLLQLVDRMRARYRLDVG